MSAKHNESKDWATGTSRENEKATSFGRNAHSIRESNKMHSGSVGDMDYEEASYDGTEIPGDTTEPMEVDETNSISKEKEENLRRVDSYNGLSDQKSKITLEKYKSGSGHGETRDSVIPNDKSSQILRTNAFQSKVGNRWQEPMSAAHGLHCHCSSDECPHDRCKSGCESSEKCAGVEYSQHKNKLTKNTLINIPNETEKVISDTVNLLEMDDRITSLMKDLKVKPIVREDENSNAPFSVRKQYHLDQKRVAHGGLHGDTKEEKGADLEKEPAISIGNKNQYDNKSQVHIQKLSRKQKDVNDNLTSELAGRGSDTLINESNPHPLSGKPYEKRSSHYKELQTSSNSISTNERQTTKRDSDDQSSHQGNRPKGYDNHHIQGNRMTMINHQVEEHESQHFAGCKISKDSSNGVTGAKSQRRLSKSDVNNDNQSDDEYYDCQSSLDQGELYDFHPEKTSKSCVCFDYRRFDWRSYIDSLKLLSDWEDDSRDSFELALANCSFGNKRKKEFYHDYTYYEHLETAQEKNVRGWDRGEYAHIAEAIPASGGKSNDQKLGDDHSANIRKKGVEEDRYTTSTGARPKTYLDKKGYKDESKDEYHDGGFKNDSSTDLKSRRLYPDLPSESPDVDQASKENQLESSGDVKSTKFGHQIEQHEYDWKTPVTIRRSPSQETDCFSDRSHKVAGSSDHSRKDAEFSKHSHRITGPMQPSFHTKDQNERIDSYSFVDYLSRQRNFTSDMKSILGLFSPHGNVRMFIKDNFNIFNMHADRVQLLPKIFLCSDHVTTGCQNRSNCGGLHLCDEYILGSCSEEACIKGHEMLTTHNTNILCDFYMEKLEPSLIVSILQMALLGSEKADPLDTCRDYNFSVCKTENCKALHVCCDYLGGLGICCRPRCMLNHDLRQKSCLKVLQSYGIDISNLSEDESFFAVIQESHKLRQMVQGYGVVDPVYKTSKPVKSVNASAKFHSISEASSLSSQNSGPLSSTCSDMVSSTSHQTSQTHFQQEGTPRENNDKKGKISQKHLVAAIQNPTGSKDHTASKKIQSSLKKVPELLANALNISNKGSGSKPDGSRQNASNNSHTVLSWYPHGDVDVAEICSYALNGTCKFKTSGCKRLHAKYDFHWQFKPNDNAGWINLQNHQVINLEQSYSNPLVDVVQLLKGDHTEKPNIVPVLLNRDTWQADFSAMMLINMSRTEKFLLRRLSSRSTGKNQKSNCFLWYFKDNNDRWVQYGDTDTSGMNHCAVNITSVEIDTSFEKGDRKIRFSNVGNFNHYVIDFKKMTQNNEKTSVIREVKRRPRPPSMNLQRAGNI